MTRPSTKYCILQFSIREYKRMFVHLLFHGVKTIPFATFAFFSKSIHLDHTTTVLIGCIILLESNMIRQEGFKMRLVFIIAHQDPTRQRIFDALKSVVNDSECMESVEKYEDSENHKAPIETILVVPDTMAEKLLRKSHDRENVRAVYIIETQNAQNQAEYFQKWEKFRLINSDITEICKDLKQFTEGVHDSAQFSFIITENSSDDESNRLEPSFMYTQLLKSAILEMEYDENDKKNFVKYCREQYVDNKRNLAVVDEFERDYSPNKAIDWYTRETFLYKMVNTALRTLDGNVIVMMGFFIFDLHREIEREHRKFKAKTKNERLVKVYRGQIMSKAAFDKIRSNQMCLLGFNSFLSTTKSREISLRFVSDKSFHEIGVLFVIKIDPNINTTPLAEISFSSNFSEDEVLFSMHAVFRVVRVVQSDQEWLNEIHMELTTDNDPQWHDLTDYLRKEAGETAWDKLGSILIKIGQTEKAEHIYRTKLNEMKDRRIRNKCYHQLGLIKDMQGKYEDSIKYYESLLLENSECTELEHAHIYNNIGGVYNHMGKYKDAYDYYQRAHDILKDKQTVNALDFAVTMANLAQSSSQQGDHEKALSLYQECIKIYEKSEKKDQLPLARIYNNVGAINTILGDFRNALKYHEEALKIRQSILPEIHPDLASTYNNMGMMYSKFKDNEKAVEFYERALKLRLKLLHDKHPDLANTYMSIGTIYLKTGGFQKAHEYLEKALIINKESLRANHPSLGSNYYNLGLVYHSMKQHTLALEYYQKALAIKEENPQKESNNITNIKQKITELKNHR